MYCILGDKYTIKSGCVIAWISRGVIEDVRGGSSLAKIECLNPSIEDVTWNTKLLPFVIEIKFSISQ